MHNSAHKEEKNILQLQMQRAGRHCALGLVCQTYFFLVLCGSGLEKEPCLVELVSLLTFILLPSSFFFSFSHVCSSHLSILYLFFSYFPPVFNGVTPLFSNELDRSLCPQSYIKNACTDSLIMQSNFSAGVYLHSCILFISFFPSLSVPFFSTTLPLSLTVCVYILCCIHIMWGS